MRQRSKLATNSGWVVCSYCSMHFSIVMPFFVEKTLLHSNGWLGSSSSSLPRAAATEATSRLPLLPLRRELDTLPPSSSTLTSNSTKPDGWTDGRIGEERGPISPRIVYVWKLCVQRGRKGGWATPHSKNPSPPLLH